MTVIIGLAIGLIIGGLIILFLSGSAKFPLLVGILFWVGIVMVVFGLILLLTPVLVWFNNQIRSMLGQ
jgi:hypothetical protein